MVEYLKSENKSTREDAQETLNLVIETQSEIFYAQLPSFLDSLADVIASNKYVSI